MKIEPAQDKSIPARFGYARFLPWLILVVSLLLTYQLWQNDQQDTAQKLQIAFDSRVREITNRIQERMQAYEQVLRGAKGLQMASVSVKRDVFRDYIATLDLEKTYRGIQGIGFSLLIPPEKLTRHIQEIRREGFPGYKLRPEGDREVYSSIIYLEPFSDRNLRAFGYDMFSEPVRRVSMERARDTGAAALSGKVVLVQEVGKEVQAGTLMYIPCYRKGMPVETVEQRRAAIYAWVYSPYRMNDLMAGVLEGNLLNAMHIEIFDGTDMSASTILYSSTLPAKANNQEASRFHELTIIEVAGRSWSVAVRSLPAFEEPQGIAKKYIIPASGIAISILLAFLGYSLLNTRDRAVAMACSMTQELTVSNEKTMALGNQNAQLHQRLSLATDSAGIGVWDYWVPENRLIWDKRMYALYGVQEENFSGAYDAWQSGLHPDDKERGDMEINQALQEEKEFDTEFRVVWPSGEVRHIKATALVLRDGEGKPLRMIGVNYDISARKAAEEELAIKQRQLQTLNETLAERVAEEVRKNREKDSLLLHQDKLAAIGQLAAGVAHEINNPMGFIMSNIATLKNYTGAGQTYMNALEEALEGRCPEEQRKQLEELRQALDIPFILKDLPILLSESQEGAERVKRIVLDLKDFARIDEDKMSETDLNRCVQSTANIVRNEIKYVADLDLQLNDIPLIVCNPQQINQVIANMLVNASQAMDKHGAITVTSQHEGEEVVLSISDTGRGMTEEVQKRVFEPFFTTKDIGKGTGLGLSITYDIIKKHGGAITLDSELGIGTTFTIRLPIKGVSGNRV